MSKLTTIRTFNSSIDYEMVKSYLESNGIDCFGKDELINRAYLANVDGGIKLQVKKEQEEDAVKILYKAGYLKDEDFNLTTEMKWVNIILSKLHKKED